MKRFLQTLKVVFATVVLIAAVGCNKDEVEQPIPPTPPTPPVITTPDKIEFADAKITLEIAFDAVAEPAQVQLTASKAWEAAMDAEAAKWLTLSLDKGESGTIDITLSAGENIETTSRSAVVTLTCGKATATITVSQKEGSEIIGFEAAEKISDIDGKPITLGEITVVSGTSEAKFQGVYWAKEYTETNDLRDKYDQLYFAEPLFSTADGTIWFSSYYCDCMIYGSQYDAWGGFILSSNVNTTIEPGKAGIANQFDAYAAGSAQNTFAAAYDAKTAGMAMSADCCWPQIDFTGGPRKVRSIELANSTWTYHYFSGAAKDSYVVKVTGKLDGKETGTVECSLISGSQKVSDWTKFDLSSLGEVDCLVFLVKSSDPNAPFYFCMDNLTLIK